MTEGEAKAYSCECPECGYRWKIPSSEWILLFLATGKTLHCPKCLSGRILWKQE